MMACTSVQHTQIAFIYDDPLPDAVSCSHVGFHVLRHSKIYLRNLVSKEEVVTAFSYVHIPQNSFLIIITINYIIQFCLLSPWYCVGKKWPG